MNSLTFVNCTPHSVIFIMDGGNVEFPPDGVCPRVSIEADSLSPIADVFPLRREHYGEVVNLPDEQPDTLFIVSRMVAEARRDRGDLIFPTDLVRDEAGRIVGCRAFGTVA